VRVDIRALVNGCKGAGGGGLSASDVAGLIWWLDAANEASVTFSSDPDVLRWEDQTDPDLDNDVGQPVAVDQPEYVTRADGKKAIWFPNSAEREFLRTNTLTPAGNDGPDNMFDNGALVTIIMEPVTGIDNAGRIWDKTRTRGNPLTSGEAAGKYRMGFVQHFDGGTNYEASTDTGSLNLDERQIVEFQYNNGSGSNVVRIWYNGVEINVDTDVGPGVGTRRDDTVLSYLLGGTGGSGTFKGYFHEFYVHSPIPSQADIDGLRAGANAKWNLGL
jgi:hypothetical protein